jgi:hypothetical protein
MVKIVIGSQGSSRPNLQENLNDSNAKWAFAIVKEVFTTVKRHLQL